VGIVRTLLATLNKTIKAKPVCGDNKKSSGKMCRRQKN